MTITLTAARQRCQFLGNDGADTKAALVHMFWIRAALQRLWHAHDWAHYKATQRLTFDVEEAGTNLTATQDGSTFVRGSTWTAKYLSQLWDCHVSGESNMAFQFSLIATVTATLATGQKWLQATTATASYTMTRFRYSLPDDFVRRLTNLEDLSTHLPIYYRSPVEFDRIRNREPVRRGRPELFTVRAGYLEVFPGPDSIRRAAQYSYMRKPTLPADADVGATIVDWPEEYADVFWKALSFECSEWLGAEARIPVARAELAYENALKATKSQDSKIVEKDEQFMLGGGNWPDSSRFMISPGPITDQS